MGTHSLIKSARLKFGRRRMRKLLATIRLIPIMALISRREKPLLDQARLLYEKDYQQIDNPLVTIAIPTWNRGKLVAERTLPSVINQTYRNIEILVVGDHCTDDTAERIAALDDPRIRFHNLPERGRYPSDPISRWQVAGTAPINKALELANGKWFAYMDDDDVYLPDHVESLLRFAQQSGYEFVYGQFRFESSPGIWEEGGRLPFGPENVPHSSTLYRGYLRFFRYNLNCYRYNMPGDADLWERMKWAGVHVGFLNKVVSLQPLRPGETGLSLKAVNTTR